MKQTKTMKQIVNGTLAMAIIIAFSAANIGVVNADTLEDARERGFITLAVADSPPWTGIDSDGNIIGGASEIAVAVLKKLGIKEVRATIVDWGAMIPGLMANRFDVIAAGLYMNTDRCAAVLYSQPDVCGEQGYMVKKGNPTGVRSEAGIAAHSTAILGTCGGCVSETRALEAGVPRDRIILIDDEQDAVKLLQQGRIDIYSYPTMSLNTLMDMSGDTNLEIISPVEGVAPACAGAAFRKNDGNLREAYDAVLKDMKDSGEFDTILGKYGFPTALAKTTPREELCGGPN